MPPMVALSSLIRSSNAMGCRSLPSDRSTAVHLGTAPETLPGHTAPYRAEAADVRVAAAHRIAVGKHSVKALSNRKGESYSRTSPACASPEPGHVGRALVGLARRIGPLRVGTVGSCP